ncbi:MAG: gfo/Idh/MocA family oxidoreductase [Phycisphaera sp.]|nr:gfo/Idh/MocA family oxidoreductase [Phycisphaera sp.]
MTRQKPWNAPCPIPQQQICRDVPGPYDVAMTDQERIPCAVVGVGRMGRHHARIYHELPQAELLAVVDLDEDRRGALADQYRCDDLETVEQLLEKYPQVRAVTVAVPTVYHEAVAAPLLERGIACLIEKPLAPSVEVAQRIVDVAKANNALVQVGHTERFNPAVRAISDLHITPRFIEVDRVSPMTFRSIDVGVVFDIMIHDIDIVLMMAKSPIKDIRAAGVAVLAEHEDVANARIEFEDGCVANLTASRLAMKTERKLRVISETSYISLNYAAKSGVIITRTANDETLRQVRQQVADGADLSDLDYTELVNREEITINDEEPLKAELTNFLDAVTGKAKPAVDADAGFAAVAAAEQIVAAIRSHTWAGIDTSKPV